MATATLLKRAISLHHTSVVDSPWNGNENVSNLKTGEPAEYYAKMYAYADEEADATTKAGYKLPHHMVSDTGVPGAANINACVAGIAALNGARGGVDIPDDEREPVYKHLAAHMKDADVTPPALKSAELSGNTQGEIVEQVYYSVLFQERLQKDASVFIRGFASVNSEDRDGDFIDPTRFDVETFMKNPQLWYNHEPWRDQNGNAKSIGKVVEAIPVVVKYDEGTLTMQLVYASGEKKGEPYRSDLRVADYAVENGMAGLFVVCEVVEAEVQNQIMDGRLNAFSWQGVAHRAKNGAITSIDLMEVSVVIIPANQRATFQVGKMYTTVAKNGNVTVIDLTAVESLIGARRKGVSLTEEEKQLAAQRTELDSVNTPAIEKGGDDMTAKEIQEKLAELAGTVTAGLKAIEDRLTAIEKADAGDAGNDAGAGDAAAAAADAGNAGAAGDAGADTGAAAAGDGVADDTATAETLAKLAEGLDAFQKVADAVSGLDARLRAIEKRPAGSTAPTDADVTATVGDMAKALSSLGPDDRRRIEKSALASTLIPDGVIKGRR